LVDIPFQPGINVAWIEEASKALKKEPIKLEFLEEVLVA
jgi:hypothetical protein